MNPQTTVPKALTIIGPGRVGRSIAQAATAAGIETDLAGRDFASHDLTGKVVLLCVSDEAIPDVAESLTVRGDLPMMVGHTSGATTLESLAGCQTAGAFSLHPLQTVPDGDSDLTGSPAAIAGSNPEALALARDLAETTGMNPFEVEEGDRATYHAAASIAANFLITLEQTAADLLEEIGVEDPRQVLSPLAERSLANWTESGHRALTGPIIRGDEQTVESHRRALASSRPEVLALYDAMAERTRELIGGRTEAGTQ